jgi:hypothetical protein
MGDTNQLNFIKRNTKIISGPILEVGSKDYGNTPNFRLLFPDYDYLGVDMEKGTGVDTVLDLTSNFSAINKKLKGKKFKTIICFSVLEHCKNPFKMCDNLSRLLDKGGIIFISVPFSWRIHAYPSDYWRFTPEGIRILFPELCFDIKDGIISTSNLDEIAPIDDYMFRAELDISSGLKMKRYNYFTGIFIGLCRKFRILPSVFSYPYLSPPVMINLIGRKK